MKQFQYGRRWLEERNQYRRWIDSRLRTLRLEDVLPYLRHRGWTEVPPDRQGFLVFQEPANGEGHARAFLLAIFRSKPSPFCILDEVDAALDEANIGRLGAVIREFLDQSQFIMVTHSKRTMASADVLYGVTMQESGISKRIAVRFEDWPDDERPAKNVAG